MTRHRKDQECVCCEKHVEEDMACYIDEYALSYGEGGGLLCESCYGDDEVVAGVHIYEPNGDQQYLGFGEYQTVWGDPDPCDRIEDPKGWSFRYVRTDGWRGYYDEVVPEGWTRLETPTWVPAFSDEADKIVEFDSAVVKVARDYRENLTVARVTARTSNVCATGYSLYVKGTQEDADRLVQQATIYQDTRSREQAEEDELEN